MNLQNFIIFLFCEKFRVRTSAIKFIEMLIIVLSCRCKESIVPNTNENDLSIEQINDDHELLGKHENYSEIFLLM